MKIAALFLILLFSVSQSYGYHKARFSLAAGHFLENPSAGNSTYSLAPKITIAYPVTPKTRDINMEFGVVNIYEAQISGNAFQAAGFGIGIRIHYNGFGFVRPYFNHEILTRLLFDPSKEGSAKTYSVLLGLGADFPFDPSRDKESPSVFVDFAYVFYDTVFFNTEEENYKALCLTIGTAVPF